MHQALNPASVRTPFGNYSHGALAPAGQRWILTSGQLAIRSDDSIPESVTEQTELIFANIAAILAEGAMTLADIVRINAFVTDRAYMREYMQVRDRVVGSPPPASTLVIVSGFTRPEFKVEIEVTAARDL